MTTSTHCHRERVKVVLTQLAAWILILAGCRAAETARSNPHWAFEKPARPPVPRQAASFPLPSHPVDAWVQARIRHENLSPSPEAPRATLLRRLSLDLTGLSPTPEEVEQFVQDTRPGAYERQMERLLHSPHYGERWGRWWLDQARYADSNGYSIDSPRDIWPFRDWVVSALNQDMPFDQFTIWQLAGDLLPNRVHEGRPERVEPWIATGFHRNTQVNHEGGIDAEQFRVESVVDRVNTTATVWLGLTLACAQCHDHKFDPLTQREYYRFLGFFNSNENDGHGNPDLEAEHHLELGETNLLAKVSAQRQAWKDRTKELENWADRELKPRQPDWESLAVHRTSTNITPLVRDLLRIPPPARGPDQTALVWRTFRDQDPDYLRRKREVDQIKAAIPPVPRSLVMKERPEPRTTRLLIKGDFTRPGDPVEPGVPVLFRESISTPRPTRLDLARWIVSTNNPLTARVIANKVWLQYFGRGLVETENDFGLQSTPPSHPELLDTLAVEFMASGWSLKQLHRLIVTSATYRQDSSARGTSLQLDPANRWLARQSRLRLDAESIRDVQLQASGRLARKLGGPPVFPPLPSGLGVFTQHDRPWKTSEGSNRYRRSLYTHIQRTMLHPALTVFDAADSYQPCTRRLRSNTPLQALTLLNDPAFVEMARAFASRLWREQPHEADRHRIQRAFKLVTARPPAPAELAALLRLVSRERQDSLKVSTASGQPSTVPTSPRDPDIPDVVEARAWTQLCRVLLNLDETITRE
ncbi:MAG: DUF1553 domain-containing protein [Verrucomicrobia bacterium]|nr:DUF1553 domain-containing protein [Verrucomicrobiota bacterium]